jgi:hypothetical protein
MLIKPGDKVLIIKNLFDGYPNGTPIDDDFYLVATKGSLGVVVTSEEFIEFILNINTPSVMENIHGAYLSYQNVIDERKYCPIKFEFVAAIEAEIKEKLGNQTTFLGVGRMQLISPDFFEVISEDEYAEFLRYEEEQ